MPPNGDAAALGFFGIKYMPTNGGKGVNVVFAPIPIHMYATLGHIVARWPILELYIDEMTKLLTNITGGDPDMRGVYNAKRRLTYHEQQFSLAFTGHPEIISYHREIMKIVKKVKRVRDYVGHAQIVGQPTKKGFTVRFIDHSIKGNKERRYLDDDLMKIASDISHAAGFLDALAKADEQILEFSSEDISALRRVFGNDRWTTAICRTLKIDHQSSLL
jgi:hypothetical protein